jgi:S-adenosyl-L-methionine hydrolase (adenosine-forming)
MSLRLITLLSDFGLSDSYVGVMKGAIAQINPALKVIDLTHNIPPQNIAAARFQLMSAFAYFPKGTVHIAVVDPGVGSVRRAIAVEFANGFLVAPDNGLLSGVLSQSPAIAAVELTKSNYWRTAEPSSTFHGRDIFAPIGAHLASGVSLNKVGQSIDPGTLVQLPLPEYRCDIDPIRGTGKVQGVIQMIDRFGNLITNIPGNVVRGKQWSVIAAGIQMPGCNTYGDLPPASLLALVGSHGWIEIGVNCGDASAKLELDYGSEITIILQDQVSNVDH